MAEYTPATEQVQAVWESALWEGIAGDEATDDSRWDAGRRLAQFDRWLAEHDREVREIERERCARVAEEYGDASPDDVDEARTAQYALGHANGINNVVEAIVNDIRALSADDDTGSAS